MKRKLNVTGNMFLINSLFDLSMDIFLFYLLLVITEALKYKLNFKRRL